MFNDPLPTNLALFSSKKDPVSLGVLIWTCELWGLHESQAMSIEVGLYSRIDDRKDRAL